MVVRTEAEFKEKIEYGFELFYKDALEKKTFGIFSLVSRCKKSLKTTTCTKTM